ncbi:small subunit processome component 20-like protein, partial [Leptotrombidium deliense]
MIWKTLISFLDVFSNFRNPKALYKEREVHSIFNSLLQHKDSVVQKSTFNCILAYSFSFVSPYKENFLRLIDNSTFKSEIVNFSLNPSNEEDKAIRDDHRSDLMPYLMRILYGKMLSKTGPNTSGQAKSTLRRSIVFRFLAGCPENELNLFINLAFAAFSDVLNLDLESVVDHYKKVDIKKCIPISKALSCLKTLEVMLFNLGNITKKLLPDFLKILIAIASFVTNLLNQRNFIKEASVTKVKVLRGECLKLSARFFEVFDEYNYSKMEIEQFFNVVVLPLLPKLSNESLSSPSPLLKLLIVWSENPRYFVLLMKKMNMDLYPLSVVIDLYSDTKCNDNVIEAISAMLVNILTLENFERMETETGELVDSIETETITPTNDFNDFNDFMSYGKFILNPFTAKIISRIKLNFDSRCKFKKSKKLLMTSNELTILTEISPFVKDESQCKVLAKLLVETFAEKQKRSLEVECQTLETIYSLVKETTTTEDGFIASFIPLFRFIVERNSRLELCKILSAVKNNNADIAILGDSISMINSYNPVNPEEPDFGVRMDGFKLIKDSMDSIVATNNQQVLSLLVYNCCFFISFVDDLGIREASSDLIQLIVQKLNNCDNRALFSKVCIEVLLLKEIRIGLRNKSEQTRDENIVLLSFLARNCNDKHPFLQQLSLLCDEDDEIDFYTTIRHIQLYRRSRTLHRFVKNVDVLEKLSSRVLSSYIVPILTGFLFDSHCRKNSGLTDASIEALGAICRYIAWPVYQKMLEHYLNVLVKDFENHKMIVKILTTILNNFKFDLTHALESENKMDSEQKHKRKTTEAKKIYDYIVSDLLPKLHKHLHTFSRSDYEYDSMKDEYPEDNEIQRVPLAFAIVKLLKALPQQTNVIEANVPSVFLRLLHFLKSKSEVIRETARNSLVKVMQSLGPQF